MDSEAVQIRIAEKPKVLFVDDEVNILAAIQRLLRKEQFQFRSTTSPVEALRLVAQEEFAVVVSDHRMPEMEGTRFLEQVKEISPNSIRILLTGYADMNSTIDAINRGSVYRFLSKPWSDPELIVILNQAVTQYNLVRENRRLHELTIRQNLELSYLNQTLEQKVEARTREITQLNRDLEKSFLASVRVLAGFTEMNSLFIGSHSQRVSTYSKGIGRLLGFSVPDALELEVASILHDIGELSIPAEIIRKPVDSLNSEELQLWQSHVLRGEVVLHLVPNFEKAAKMVRHHHEKFNGTGFPNRLRGEDIPMGARIIAVADAYDGVLNSRANFHDATPEKAMAWLENRAGLEYDPAVVDALKSHLKQDSSPDEKDEVQVAIADLRQGML
jgi:response regulator RpfG family c-di-GMP phosphodiesterase